MATGDILYRGADGAWHPLAIGAEGTVLTVSSSGIPSWTSPTALSATIIDAIQYLMFRDDNPATVGGCSYDGFGNNTLESYISGSYTVNDYYTGDDMTLECVNMTALAQPTKARISIFLNPVDSPTLNTDIKAYASRDGGVTWNQITLAKVADLPGSIDQLTGEVSLTSSGTAMKWKITTHNSKTVDVTGVGLSWF